MKNILLTGPQGSGKSFIATCMLDCVPATQKFLIAAHELIANGLGAKAAYDRHVRQSYCVVVDGVDTQHDFDKCYNYLRGIADVTGDEMVVVYQSQNGALNYPALVTHIKCNYK